MSQIVRFDRFEVDLALGQLRKRGVRIRLREQSFQILASLLECPGQLVTRDDLRRRLWTDTVFVDFDNSLNIAVARLREALGDSADRPRFVETVPRRGYRFIGTLSSPALKSATGATLRLVVLPLVNSNGDPAHEYFADSMTDEVITALAAVARGQLAVIARTTAMHYKGSHDDVGHIARELNVDYVVEGSVRRTEQKVSVKVQLIDARRQTHLFSRRYEGKLADIFAVHHSIAQGVVAHIPTVADRARGGQAMRQPTEDLAAYNEYLQARHEMWTWTAEGIAKAKQLFEAALARDPRFALACDGLANLYGYLGLWGFLPPDEAEPLRWFYGCRAFELDPSLAEARTHVAYHPQKTRHEGAYSYNWQEAERDMGLARDLNPASPLIRARHSSVLLVLGHIEQALAELQCALEFDPLSPEVHCWLAWALFLGRQHERALVAARKLVDLEPKQPFAYMVLGQAYLGMQRFEESAAAQAKAAELSRDFPLVLGWLGLALGLGGRAGEARALLARLHAIARERFVLPTSFAWAHVGLGEIDDAFAWMNRAVERNDEWIHPIKSYPFLDPLRADPRLHALVRKLNLEP